MGLLKLITGRKQEVILPISIGKAVYIVAGERGYEGDLIVTQNVIYYFPHTDLIRRRISNTANLSAVLLMGGGSLGGILATALNNNLRRSQQRDNSDLPKGEDITASLEERLDAYIQTRKEERKDALLGESLPLPMRFQKSGIERIRLTSRGFAFDASFDNHQFILRNSSLLKGALQAGAYTT
ncbi:MAG: hypothetical protein ACR2HX_15930 [Pyrinomonadaceae bacterium]